MTGKLPNFDTVEFWTLLHYDFFLSKCLNNFFVAIFSAGKKPQNNAAATSTTTNTNNSTKEANPTTSSITKYLKSQSTVNKRLIPLKLTLFFFSASAFSILPYLTIHMKDIGIKVEHIGKLSHVTMYSGVPNNRPGTAIIFAEKNQPKKLLYGPGWFFNFKNWFTQDHC